MMKQILVGLALSLSFATTALAADTNPNGVTGSDFWVNNVSYRSVNTPTDLPADAPESTFDNVYITARLFGGCGPTLAVGDKAPGDVGFNGGRWNLYFVIFGDRANPCATFERAAAECSRVPGDFRYFDDLQCAFDRGLATPILLRKFECPVVRDNNPLFE